MSGDCEICGEHHYDCLCLHPPIPIVETPYEKIEKIINKSMLEDFKPRKKITKEITIIFRRFEPLDCEDKIEEKET